MKKIIISEEQLNRIFGKKINEVIEPINQPNMEMDFHVINGDSEQITISVLFITDNEEDSKEFEITYKISCQEGEPSSRDNSGTGNEYDFYPISGKMVYPNTATLTSEQLKIVDKNKELFNFMNQKVGDYVECGSEEDPDRYDDLY